MKNVKFLISLFAAIAMSLGALAQVDLISADEFMKMYKGNDELVVLDANKSKNYSNSHVKNALHINHMDLYKEGDVSGLIMEPADLAVFFGNLGISENTPVVIYDDGSQKYNTRVYWVLKYLGANDVKLLHKDMETWRDARIPLTSAPGKAKAVTFTPNVQPAYMAMMDEVKALPEREDAVLVDCRTPEEFRGESKSEGHIPGAINMNYTELLTETGAFKSADELRQIADSYGISPDMEVIFYCKTSVRAAVNWVAFRNILGYEKVKVYDGAYNEWIASSPVVQ